jgi:hypothetical protein
MDEALTLLIPLPEVEVEPMTAMDLSGDAEYLAIVSEDSSIIVVGLLDLMCESAPSWAEVIGANRATQLQRPRLLGREKGTFEMLADLFGGPVATKDAVDASALRFTLPGVAQDNSSVTSAVWWTREPPEDSATAVDGQEDGTSNAVPSAEYLLVIGSLSGRLTIIDIVQQTEVRSFNLAPIVWLQRCQSRCQEWLLIETAAEPKHWKLLLSTSIDQSGPNPLRWSIVDGTALPTSASQNFELEPISGLPSIYQLLVVSKGRDDSSSSAATAVDGNIAAGTTEVLGLRSRGH